MIDDSWKEHLREMDDLKQSVQGAVYEQKDPLLIYKFEAYELFKQMLDKVNKETGAFLVKGNLPVQNQNEIGGQVAPNQTDTSQLKESRQEDPALTAGRPSPDGQPGQHRKKLKFNL